MSSPLEPGTDIELATMIGDALADHESLEIFGGGSKRSLGQPLEVDREISLAGLSGITLYEPEELVLSARAGTPLTEIQECLAEKGQELAFEPPDWRALLGTTGEQTIGGIVATNLAGPRRIRAGAPRDHLLGVSLVTGRAETVKTGGRVVKNVTGYDLCKLVAGSYGTLGIATDLTVKVLPAGEKTRTVLVSGLDAKDAVKALNLALSSPHDVSAAAYVPGVLTGCSSVSYVSGAGAALAAVRIEGPGPSVEARCLALRDILSGYGAIEELHFHNSSRFWKEIADVSPFFDTHDVVWRVSVPPSIAASTVQRIQEEIDADFYFDWGGGLIWIGLKSQPADGGASVVRGAFEIGDGHATLVRAHSELRSTLPVFQPQTKPVKALSQRIKRAFDPGSILNPGRMSLSLEAANAN